MTALSRISLIKNVIRMTGWKLRYGKRLSGSLIQNFGKRSSIEIHKNGRLTLGKAIFSRSNTVIVVTGNGSCTIGNNVYFNNNCAVTAMEEITIGDRVTIGNNTVIVDHDHDYRNPQAGHMVCSKVSIGANTWIGANCVILRGCRIGRDCVVAAGSVVMGSIPDHTIYYQKRETVCKPYEKQV